MEFLSEQLIFVLIQQPDTALGKHIDYADKFLPLLRRRSTKNSVGLVMVRVLMSKTVPDFDG